MALATKMFPGALLLEHSGGHELPNNSNGKDVLAQYMAWCTSSSQGKL